MDILGKQSNQVISVVHVVKDILVGEDMQKEKENYSDIQIFLLCFKEETLPCRKI